MDYTQWFVDIAQSNISSGYYSRVQSGSGLKSDRGIAESKLKKVSLKQAISVKKFSIISEFKHCTPGKDYCIESFDVPWLSKEFRKAGSVAISVVVEPCFFKGRLDEVMLAKQSGLPVVFKDFVISEVQLKAAASLYADAVLIVQSVLGRAGIELESLVEKAHLLGLEAFVECHSVNEVLLAISSGADVIGINNRDLSTMRVDITFTERILRSKVVLSAMEESGLPVVSESGVRAIEDIDYIKTTGANGVLIGSALWKSRDPVQKLKELAGS